MNTLTDIEQLTLDFARLVAGYPDAAFYGAHLRDGSASSIGQLLPDYPNDWNATIGAIEARGLIWERKVHRSRHFKDSVVYYVSDAEWNVTKSESVNTDEPHCIALMRAAVEAAKSITIEDRKYADRDNPE